MFEEVTAKAVPASLRETRVGQMVALSALGGGKT